ncbi:alpha-E domain-containing protein [Kocuria rosea]|uniref:alpha-E domain-containing protein n=1 Tax=Kocuria rosea TaxID=1275 RepID=UPI00203A54ED|nr:alpha-E domain-containing protein [Kocuria rosea]MCM3687105.1 alpha-E domain-containing protein [Kocuria rosea]
MLSRIAESLFWIGRYVERADGVARILDVHLERITQLPPGQQETEVRRIMEVMGVTPTDGVYSVKSMIHELAWNRDCLTSISGALHAARENARRARESMSSPMWEALNSTFYGLGQHRRDVVGTFRVCHWTVERMATVRGQVQMTMSRDESWMFLSLGAAIERADMTSRLLWTRSTSTSGMSWVSILHCAGAYEAFLRTRYGTFNDESATEFLLLDRLFPGSILHSLTTAEEVLVQLEPGIQRVGFKNDARRIIGEARTALEFHHAEDLIAVLPEHLNNVQAACARASEAVGAKYFSHAVEASWFGGIL